MAFLVLSGLTKRFGPVTAERGLDLQISRGEIYALLGPNGAGKTTTLRMIAGITPPTSGTVVLDGLDLEKSSAIVKSKFFFIPDRPYLYEKLTGREYLEFLINIYGRGDVSTLKELLIEFEMTSRLDQFIESYSHGMRQKLLLAAAFMLDPPLLIVDEPLVGLDPKSSAVLKRKLVEFSQGGRISLISTHQLALAESIASRVGIIHLGRMLAEGSAQDLRDLSKRPTLEEAFLTLTESEEN